jgi:nucleoid-associated protein YgaU
VQSIETRPGGRVVARGVADPNSTVRFYLSGAFVGDAKTGADGKWSLTIRHGVTPGPYALRADQISPASASVTARAEAPFDYAALNAAKPGADIADPATSAADIVVDSVLTHHVEPGHTLWGISQKFYGDGSRYQLIFEANTNQIRDPNLIYPGQTFVVPKSPKP